MEKAGTKASKDPLHHVNCFYFYFASILCPRSSLANGCSRSPSRPRASHTPCHFYPGPPAPLSHPSLQDRAAGKASRRAGCCSSRLKRCLRRPLDLISQNPLRDAAKRSSCSLWDGSLSASLSLSIFCLRRGKLMTPEVIS